MVKYSKEIKAGIVVIITLIAFFILFNFLKGKNVFVNGRVFYVQYDNVNGLAPSKPVTVNGLRVGRVDEIKIMDKTQPIYFVVKLTIERDMKFSNKTIAEIYEPGFLSGKEVRLLLDYNGKTVESGDTLQGKTAESLTALLQEEVGPTKNKIDSLLVSVSATSNQLQQLLDDENAANVKQLIRNLNNTVLSYQETAIALRKTSDNASKLIATNEQKIGNVLEQTSGLMNQTQHTVEKYGQVADKVNQLEFDKTLKNFESASKKLDDLLTKFNDQNGTMGALLNDKTMYNNLNETSVVLKELMQDFKENPKRYVQFSVFGKKDKTQKEPTK